MGPVAAVPVSLTSHVHGQATGYASKWVTFAASAFIQACAGLSYSFSVYSPVLKEQLDLTQTQLATVGSAVNLGGYFALLAGSIYDWTKNEHKLGPRLVVWLGCLACFCGYLGLYLLASGAVPGDYLLVLLFAACAGNAGTWFDTSTLVTNVRNFPDERGFVVGILKSFFGLSASIYTSVYMATFDPDAVSYLLMLSIVPPLLCSLLALFLNYVPFMEASEQFDRRSWLSTQGRFLLVFFLVAAIAAYQMAGAAMEGQQSLAIEYKQMITAGMLVLLALVALLPYHSGGFWAVYAREYSIDEGCLVDSAPASPMPTDLEHGYAEGVQGSSSTLPFASHTGLEHRHHRSNSGAVNQRQAAPSSRQQQQQARQGSKPRKPEQQHPTRRVSSNGGGNAPGHQAPAAAPAVAGPSAGAGSWPAPAQHLHSSQGFMNIKQAASGVVSSSSGPEAAPRRGPSPNEASPAGATAERRPAAASIPVSSRLGLDYAPLPTSGDVLDGQHSSKISGSAAAAAVLDKADEVLGDPGLLLPQMNIWQMMRQLVFWAYFLQFMLGTGVCLSYLNNLGQLVVALGGQAEDRVVFVSLFSVANAAGRLLMGYLPEQALHNRGTARPWFLVGTAALMTLAAYCTAVAPIGVLYLISLLLGGVFGAHWSLLPAITSDTFGLTHFAVNYAGLQLAPACGSYLLATWLTGYLYDKAASAGGDIHACIGYDCFGPAFRILAAASAVSTCTCAWAAVSSRPLYSLMSRHLRHTEAAAAGQLAEDM